MQLGFLQLLLGLGLPISAAAETVLGIYLFSRHGDRTAKALNSTHLTELGYKEIYDRGSFYRNRYVASNATNRILNISADDVNLGQILAQSPYDAVLMPSAQGFLQGLYPPVGASNSTVRLRDNTSVETPLNGYQIIPVQTLDAGANSENSAWLQGQTNCANALASSNQYLASPEYNRLLNSTSAFYKNFTDLTNGTFPDSRMSFKYAYTIFDLFNVAEIHNTTFDPQNVLQAGDNFLQLRTLADAHEWNSAYNASSTIRAIAGATLASQIVTALNQTINSTTSPRMNIQFGPYGSFQSFFGLSNLTAASPDFYGIPDYASSMVFELVTNSSTSSFPRAQDIGVRFYFHNGTASNSDSPTPYPLFGQQNDVLSWDEFVANMNKFSIGTQSAWCRACGNSTGVCASAVDQPNNSSNSAVAQADGSGSHMSNAVAGVIGAMVTLGVILGLELLAILIGGLRVVRKRQLTRDASSDGQSVKA